MINPIDTSYAGKVVTLDGSNSFDPDNNIPLSYTWSLIEKPFDSQVILDSSNQKITSFTADKLGNYLFSLVVTDSLGLASLPAQINIIVINKIPVANAGPDQTVHAGWIASLDGTNSFDEDGNYPLIYSWAIVEKPETSQAILTDSNQANASINIDQMGDYVIQFIVKDNLGGISYPSFVHISTTNSVPIANAVPDQSILVVGAEVQLDGSQSWDTDGDIISYQWNIQQAPEGSNASISNPNSISPIFIPDKFGTYLISLIVKDNWSTSLSDEVIISFENIKPVALAGNNKSCITGDIIYLDGSASFDANNDSLSYNWQITSKPSSSSAIINQYTSIHPNIQPDVRGTYIISLVVNDGILTSDPSNITIFAICMQDAVVAKIQQVIDLINNMPESAFRNKNMANTLTNKLNVITEKISNGVCQGAYNQLNNDVLSKMDGCAVNGVPDKNDWIINCIYQGQVYPIIIDVLNYMKNNPCDSIPCLKSAKVANSPLSINSEEIDNYRIYPNPCKDYLNIINSFDNKTTFALYSIEGKLIIYKSLECNSNNIINLNTLSEGIYLIKLSNITSVMSIII